MTRETEIDLDDRGRLVTRQRFLCPNCVTFHWTREPPPRRFRCPRCHAIIPTRLGLALSEIAFDVSYFGWFYGIADEAEEERRRREGWRLQFKLDIPIDILQLLGLWVATGIVGNLGYDLIRAGARTIYRRFRPARIPKSELDGQVITAAQGLQNLPDLLRHALEAIDSNFGEGKSTRRRLLKILIEAEEEFGMLRKLTRRKVKLQAESTQTLPLPKKPIRARKFSPLGATVMRTKQRKVKRKRRRSS